MRATIATSCDPFHPASHRTFEVLDQPRTVAEVAPRTTQPFICSINGVCISRKAWEDRVIEDNDIVSFVLLPQGGEGGSNPLKIMLMIAVSVLTHGLGGALLGIEGAAAVGSFGVGIANAVVSLVGRVSFPKISRSNQ